MNAKPLPASSTPVTSNIELDDAIALAKTLIHRIPPKSALASWSIGGLSILFLLQVAEIITGDPFTLNGGIKTFLLLSGAALNVKGRIGAVEPLALTLPGTQKKRAEALKASNATGVTELEEFLVDEIVAAEMANLDGVELSDGGDASGESSEV